MAAPVTASPARKFAADVFRPAGPTVVQLGVAGLTGVGTGPIAAVTRDINGQVDLSLPLRGFRFIAKLRLVVGTAAYTSSNPETFTNLISKLRITGNFRGQGVTIVDSDLSTLYGMGWLNSTRNGFVNVNGVELASPGVPYSAQSALGTGTFDVIISFDYFFSPYGIPGRYEAGFLMRQEDWTNVNIHLEFPGVTDNANNPLGLSAATTTSTISAIGGPAGTMTVDIYALPVRMGKASPTYLPGLLTRTAQAIPAATLQVAMANTLLVSLQKNSTPRIYTKFGTQAAAGAQYPVFKTLADNIITAQGILIGTNKNIRDLVDVFAVRSEVENEYDCNGVGGYFLEDFIQKHGNIDRAFPGDALTAQQTFNLVANGAGTANAIGTVLQEQVIVHPHGLLFG